MCVYSMVMDHYIDRWGRLVPTQPTITPWVPQTYDPPWVVPQYPVPAPSPMTPEEQAKEIQQFKDLIERAKKYDKANNQPDCELDEKRKALKKIADELGIDITFV